jgi:hypothetical protein
MRPYPRSGGQFVIALPVCLQLALHLDSTALVTGQA